MPTKMRQVCCAGRTTLAFMLLFVAALIQPNGFAYNVLLHERTTKPNNIDASSARHHRTSVVLHETSSSISQAVAEAQDTQLNHAMCTSAILRISYDGARFTGWSAANQATNATGYENFRLSRRKRKKGILPEPTRGFVRPVESMLKTNLAKLYGNVDPGRVVVEGCSRTDKGVHALSMIAEVYCVKQSTFEALQHEKDAGIDASQSNIHRSVPGKFLPHPRFATDDSYFEKLPMNGNLSRLAFSLNRMLPGDLRVTGVALVPETENSDDPSAITLPFHPTLSCVSKKYTYRLSIGPLVDPSITKQVWHIPSAIEDFNVNEIKIACNMLQGSHGFAAFQGAPRGADEKRRRIQQHEDTEHGAVCTLSQVSMTEIFPEGSLDCMFPAGLNPPCMLEFSIIGDRFLYKMVRFIVGALVAIGKCELSAQDLQLALQKGSWKAQESAEAGTAHKPFQCAPANGLVLDSIDYGDSTVIHWEPIRDSK